MDNKPAPQIVAVVGQASPREFDTPQLTREDMEEAAELLQKELEQQNGPGYRLEDCLRTVQARARRIESNAPKAHGYREWFLKIGLVPDEVGRAERAAKRAAERKLNG
jgi:hypothetical protein